ncbi:insulinase family protein [Candidatus Peregrinibacteria bacterium]|nr:insulinase family protein [Candidatus Peregrinibacteria bacterium]
MQYQLTQLKNKANVILVPQAEAQSVTVLVMFPVGSRYETEKLSGVSHFIEHMMYKGTKKRPNTLILTREIDRLGADYNAFTEKEFTGYYIKANKDYIETILDILADMLNNSLFDAEEIQREKTVIVEELRMYRDNPLMNIGNIFEELMYQNCPLGRDIGGIDKTVMGIKRQEMLAYRDKYYRPDNMTIVVAGNVDVSIEKKLNRYFINNKEIKETGDRKYKPAKYGSVAKNKCLRVEQKKTDQAQLMFGFPGLNHNSKHNPALGVLNTILGGSMSSRLFIKIRERLGLAYMVRSGVDSYRDTGYFYIRAGLDAKNIKRAIKVSKQEMEKILEKGVTDRELKDAKTHIRGGLALAMEDSSAQASWYAKEALFRDEIKTPEERLQEIEAVTNKDIKTVADKLFDFKKMRVAVIGEVETVKLLNC